MTNKQPSRCPHCGYVPGVIPSDFDAYAQANCEHRESHEKPGPAELEGEATSEGCAGAATAPLPTDSQLREQMPDKARCAVEFFRDDRNSYGSVTAMWGFGQAITLRLSDLTLRLAKVEEQLKVTEAACERNFSRAESAEARVAELDAHYLAACKQLALAEARVAELEAQLSGVGVRQYREAVERLHKAEARVRELVAEAAKRPLASDDEQTIADLEAFKARVMESMRGDCVYCGTNRDACMTCINDARADCAVTDNWTPPQAWEVGE